MSDDTLTEKKQKLGFQITGFILGIVSFFIGLLPYIALIPAILGLTFSVLGARRITLKGLSITGIVLSSVALVTSSVTSAFFFSYQTTSSDRASCQEYFAKLEPITKMMQYMETDITAQNLTGYYDPEGMIRQSKVLTMEFRELDDVRGSDEFNKLRGISVSKAVLFYGAIRTFAEAGFNNSRALQQPEAELTTALEKLGTYCDSQ